MSKTIINSSKLDLEREQSTIKDENEDEIVAFVEDSKIVNNESQYENIDTMVMQDLVQKRMISGIQPTEYLLVNVYKHPQRNIPQQVFWGFNFRQKSALSETMILYNVEFLRIILLMTLIMCLFSLVLILYIILTPDLRFVMSMHVVTFVLISLLVFIFIDYAFVCSECARVGPCNFVFLCITVSSLSTLAGTICAHADSIILLLTILAMTFSVLVAVVLSCTKFDFTSQNLYTVMLASAFVAIGAMLAVIKLTNTRQFDAVWCIGLVFITFVEVVLFIMQLQKILNKKTVKLKDDDYALGAFMLYASTFDIFLKMTQTAGRTT